MSFIFTPVCALCMNAVALNSNRLSGLQFFTSSIFYSVKRKHKEFLKWIKKGIKKNKAGESILNLMQPITDSPYGINIFFIIRAKCFHFIAQVADNGHSAYYLRSDTPGIPDTLKQIGLGKYFVGISH